MKIGASVKLATGDQDKSLGTGSTDYSVNYAYRKMFNKFHGTIRLGLVSRGEGTVRGTQFDYGDSLTAVLATDYKLSQDSWLGLDLIYVNTKGTADSFTTTPTLTIMDAIASFSYNDYSLKAIIPLSESHTAPTAPPTHDTTVSLGWTKSF